MQEECHLMEALTLSMSRVALLTIWLYLTELFSQRPTTHTQKRQNCGQAHGGGIAPGTSAVAAAGALLGPSL